MMASPAVFNLQVFAAHMQKDRRNGSDRHNSSTRLVPVAPSQGMFVARNVMIFHARDTSANMHSL
jgi:hypothetical protein